MLDDSAVVVVPDEFASWTIARQGDRGRTWIEQLPGVIAAHLDCWSLTPDGSVLHGHVGIVLPVARADGEQAVLKVSWTDGGDSWEAHALAAWSGRGAVRLLERDDAAGVLLLERLDPSRSARELDRVAAASLAGEMCRRLETPAPPGLPGLEEVACEWAEELPRSWERLGRPFSARLVQAAVRTCRDLGPDQPDRLLHGNLRLDHMLRAEREPWLVIDPNGMAGDPAYEIAPLLGNLCPGLRREADPRQAVRVRLVAFADAAGVDLERARRWAQAYLVNEAIWCREHQPDAVPHVDALVEALG
jgi:streptomycin 6-kinase